MTPAERQQKEDAYDRLRALYDVEDIRGAEMAELSRLWNELSPIWEAETVMEPVPGVDAQTGGAMALEPPRGGATGDNDTRKPNTFGDVGSTFGNENLAAAGYLLRNAWGQPVDQESMIPAPVQWLGNGLNNIGLSGLLALGGMYEKGVGYAAELSPGGTNTERQLARDILGGLEVAGVGPEARMVSVALDNLMSNGLLKYAAGRSLDDVDTLLQRRHTGKIPDYASLTHEMQPYGAIATNVDPGAVGVDARRMLPNAADMTPDARMAYFNDPASSWVNKDTGGDMLSEIVGAKTLPTIRGQGVYYGPQGLENNPMSVGRSYATQGQLQATESVRGLLDVQGATPWTRLRAGDAPAVYLPHNGAAASVDDIARIKTAGSKYGLDEVWDIGDGYVATGFDDPHVGPLARRSLGKASGRTPMRTTMESGYPGYEGAWEQGGVAAIDRFLENIDGADPAAISALDNSPELVKLAQAKAARLTEAGRRLGGGNATVEEIPRAIGRGPGWIDRLRATSEYTHAREIPQQSLANIPTGSQSLPAAHFSPTRIRGLIDPARAGDNDALFGAERGLPDPNPQQSYFGLDVGQPGGYTPENGVGKWRHDVTLPQDRMLDITTGDWGSVATEADAVVARVVADSASRGMPMTETAIQNLREAYLMRIAQMQGYEGLINRNAPAGAIATMFNGVPVKKAPVNTARGLLSAPTGGAR